MCDNLQDILQQQAQLELKIHNWHESFVKSNSEDEREHIFASILVEYKNFQTKHKVINTYKEQPIVIASKYFDEQCYERTMAKVNTINSYFAEKLSLVLEQQLKCITLIGKMYSNFKKDSQSRKTKTYLTNKLQLLDNAIENCTTS